MPLLAASCLRSPACERLYVGAVVYRLPRGSGNESRQSIYRARVWQSLIIKRWRFTIDMQFPARDTSHPGGYTDGAAVSVVTPSRPGSALGGFFVVELLSLLLVLILVLIREVGG